MGVAVSKISMLTHCQALTQACNYCEGQTPRASRPLYSPVHPVFVCPLLLMSLCPWLRGDSGQRVGLQEGHGFVARRVSGEMIAALCSVLQIIDCFPSAQWDFGNVCLFLAECHEQDPHHHSAICCHESLSNVLGAEGPHSQRFGFCLHLTCIVFEVGAH